MLVMSPSCRPRGGFTLVELLVVILIIAMLAALLTSAVWRAQIAARNARITSEINNLDMAIKSYRDRNGEFFPDFALLSANYADQVVARHIRRAYPRYGGAPNYATLRVRVQASCGRNLGNPNAPINQRLDAAESLVFFLGGVPNVNRIPEGYSADPRDPFLAAARQSQRIPPLFDFAEEQLFDADNDGWPEFYPPGMNPATGGMPYVYFSGDPRSGTYIGAYIRAGAPANNVARPYGFTRDNINMASWVHPDTFQIIAAGLDNTYGTPANLNAIPLFPNGRNYSQADMDNLTNFSRGTLGDAIP
jgi:general secretion pathway protein G